MNNLKLGINICKLVASITISATISMFPQPAFAKDVFSDLLRKYDSHPVHKAWAVSSYNGYSYRAWRHKSESDAKRNAIMKCNKLGGSCSLIYINDKKVGSVKNHFSFPTKLSGEDDTGKKFNLTATTQIANYCSYVSPLKIHTKSGDIFCKGTRKWSGNNSLSVKLNCLGVDYSGRFKFRGQSFRGNFSA